MAKTYRATCDSFGFRSRHWVNGDIATDVQESEQIPEHFVEVAKGEKIEPVKHESFVPPEPTTLSELTPQPPEPKKKKPTSK